MAEFTLGARVSCSDGFCGVVSRTIPVSAVTSVDAGIRLNITKQQVEDLPPLGHTG